MSLIKQFAERQIQKVLKTRGVPEPEWPALIKKTGRGMILLGVASVVPLLLIDEVSLPITIVLQVCYACLMYLGLILAFDNKNVKSSPR